MSGARLAMVLTVCSFAGIGLLVGRVEQWRVFEGLLFLLALLLGLAGWLVRRGAEPRLLGAALLAGLVARIGFLAQPPSNDVWRYLWEGRVQLAGYNPYRLAPSDPALAALRDGSHALINHPGWTAIYGPLAEAIFAAVSFISPTVLGWKLCLLLVEGLVLWLLWQLLRRRGRSSWWLLGYAWHPLVLWTVAGEAHLELLMVAGVLGAILALETERPALGGVCLACAMLIKPTALLFAPLLCIPRIERRAMLALCVTLVVGYLPYLGAGRGLLASLLRFGAAGRFNDLPSLVMGPVAARLLALGVLAGAVILLWRRGASRSVLATWLAGLFLLVSPTVHPWYALVLIPLLCLEGGWAWWVLTFSLILAGETRAIELATGQWSEPAWIRWAVYGPFLLAVALTFWARARRTARPSDRP